MHLKRPQSQLWEGIRDGGMATLAVMGMSKNTGKTVALNRLLACAAAEDVAVGLTSIGRDGEALDQVFSIPKPPVVVWPGALVATARETLQRARARCKLIDGSGIDSPMGEIVVVKVLDGGEMEIAGASRGHDQLKIIARLRQCGASQVFLDGALGRSQHASPAIADGVVLATGAAVGGGIQDVIRKTRDRLAILGIAEADAATAARCASVFAEGGVGMWDADGKVLFRAAIPSLNAGSVLLANDQPSLAGVAVSGAVGRQLWQALETLARRHKGLQVVVADGTRLFVDAGDLAAFRVLGGQLAAMRRIRLAGLTLNPFSPLGGHFAAHEFLEASRAAFDGLHVTDVLLEQNQQEEQLDGSFAA